VSEEELERAKNQLEAGYLFGQDSLHGRASTLGRYERVAGWRLRDEYIRRVRTVTPADIQTVARRYFVDDHKTTAVLIPSPPAASVRGH
jgi:zinc protease